MEIHRRETMWSDAPQILDAGIQQITGAVPALNFSAITGCGFGKAPKPCWFLSSSVSNVYDEESDSGVTNSLSCPRPPGAAKHCHGVCSDADGKKHGYDIDCMYKGDAQLASSNSAPKGHTVSKQCQQCKAADLQQFPQCDAQKTLNRNQGHISATYCTDKDFVVFAYACRTLGAP